MGDDYADLVELGFEGLNHFTDKYHDPVADFARKHTPKLSPFKNKGRDGKGPDQSQRGLPRPTEKDTAQGDMDPQNPEQYPRDQRFRSQDPRSLPGQYAPTPSGAWSEQTRYYQDLPPPPTSPHGAPSPPRQRENRRPDRHDRYETDSESDGDYHGRGRGKRDRRDSSYSEYGYGHRGRETQPMVQRGSSPPGYAVESRGRPQAARRGSSWPPPRSKSKSQDRRRGDDPPSTFLARSNSPNAKYRFAAALAGAFAGGYAGSRLQKDQPVANSVSTVLGAVVGGLGAREAEQAWTERRRQRRRAERERG